MKLPLLLAATFLLFPLTAQTEEALSEDYFPQQMTARDLMQACASSLLTKTGRERRRYCRGFVSGVEETARLIQLQDSSSQASSLCVPDGKSSREFAGIYMQYAVRKEVDLNRAAALVVIDSLRDAYPCPLK